MSFDERRRHPRVVVDAPVTLTVAGEVKTARLRDVCRDAALVEASHWEPLQTDVSVGIELPGTAGPFEVAGRVIRLAPGEQATHAMAILFSAPSAEAEARINELVHAQRGRQRGT